MQVDWYTTAQLSVKPKFKFWYESFLFVLPTTLVDLDFSWAISNASIVAGVIAFFAIAAFLE